LILLSKSIQIKSIKKQFDKLQNIYGDKNLNSIYGSGETNNPKGCFVFMNSIGRNVSANKGWKGLKAPWIGTKNVWKLFYQLGLLNKDLFYEISSKDPEDWTYDFSENVYKEVKSN